MGKKVVDWLLRITGIKRNSRYVRDYLNDANIRSSIYMALVIVALEVWMLFRQINEKIIPEYTPEMDWLSTYYRGTSNFILMMLVGLSVFFFAVCYSPRVKNKKVKLILPIVFGGLCFGFSFTLIYKAVQGQLSSNPLSRTLTIIMYVSAGVLGALIIAHSLFRHFRGKNNYILDSSVITFFAFVCLVFGIMVSYSDLRGGKEIMCFLTMAIYVGCLLIWKPYISIILITASFHAFFLVAKRVENSAWQDGDTVNYITFFISLVMVAWSIHSQRVNEGNKDEELEKVAITDKLTGLPNYQYFTNKLEEKAKANEIDYGHDVLLFFNIVSFKLANYQKHFEYGSELLKKIAKAIEGQFPGELVARQADDHFVALVKKTEGLEDKLLELKKKVFDIDDEVHPILKTGCYFIKNEDVIARAIDKARYACQTIDEMSEVGYRYFDDKLDFEFRATQHVLRHIDEALDQNWVKPYYQPVVYAEDQKLCGYEALARWEDPQFGLISPGAFVPPLEKAKLIYKMDEHIVEAVCQDIRSFKDESGFALPVSINFSRLDFEAMDVVALLDEVTEKYKVNKKLLHVEITESALTSNLEELKNIVSTLKKKGYEVWLDDFGSGYSSLNVLKDFEFDVVKMDMRFLEGFDDNPKAKEVIRLLIPTIDKLGLKTLHEGVETPEQAAFLKEVGCGRLQGYNFGKAQNYDATMNLIKDGKLKPSAKAKIKD